MLRISQLEKIELDPTTFPVLLYLIDEQRVIQGQGVVG